MGRRWRRCQPGRGVAIRCQPGRGAAWCCLLQDVVLLGSICCITLCCCCAVSCAVVTGLLLLLCCLHLPRSVVLSSPASFCRVVFTSVVSTASKSLNVSNNATRYGLMRLTGLIDSGKVALDVKHFSLNICHFNLLVGVALFSLPRYTASGVRVLFTFASRHF